MGLQAFLPFELTQMVFEATLLEFHGNILKIFNFLYCSSFKRVHSRVELGVFRIVCLCSHELERIRFWLSYDFTHLGFE